MSTEQLKVIRHSQIFFWVLWVILSDLELSSSKSYGYDTSFSSVGTGLGLEKDMQALEVFERPFKRFTGHDSIQIITLYNKISYRYTRRLQDLNTRTVWVTQDIPTGLILSVELSEDLLDMIDYKSQLCRMKEVTVTPVDLRI